MKGISIAVSIIIVAALVILVLGSLSGFLFGETTRSMTILEAERVLTECCSSSFCSTDLVKNWQRASDVYNEVDEFHKSCNRACNTLHPEVKSGWECVRFCGCELGNKEQVNEILDDTIDDILITARQPS